MYEILNEEKFLTVSKPNRPETETDVLRNPSKNELLRLLNTSGQPIVRALLTKTDLFCWNPYNYDHFSMRHELGPYDKNALSAYALYINQYFPIVYERSSEHPDIPLDFVKTHPSIRKLYGNQVNIKMRKSEE